MIMPRTYPEEHLRQQLLHRLTRELSYPPHQILIEKEHRRIASHFSQQPSRTSPLHKRVDILIIPPLTHHLVSASYSAPLLLIECKASSPTQKSWIQLLSYQQSIRAFGFAVISPQTTHVHIPNRNSQLSHTLPNYQELIDLWTHHINHPPHSAHD